MCGIEILVIFAVRTLNFAVMTRSIRFDEFVLYATLFEKLLKQRGCWFIGTAEPFGELLSVIGLDALYFELERLEHMLQEYCRSV